MQNAAVSTNHSELRQRIVAYLGEHTTLNLATYGPAGLWVAAVLYVHDGTDLYFTSVAATRHSYNLAATNRAAGTINVDCTELANMTGVQLDGDVARITDRDELRKVVTAYLRRFPFSAGLWNGETDPEVIADDPGVHDFYRLSPNRLLFWEAGRREELL